MANLVEIVVNVANDGIKLGNGYFHKRKRQPWHGVSPYYTMWI